MEVDDNELIQLRGAKKLLDTLQGEKTGREFHKLVKVYHPEHNPPPSSKDIEEIREEAKVTAQKIFDDEREKARKEAVEKAFQEKLNSYKISKDNPDGYTQEGLDEIVKLMKERTIPDVDAAVALFEKQNPPKPEPPAGFAGTSWGFGQPPKDDENQKLLYTDPDAWAEQEAIKVVTEARRGMLAE